MAAIIQILGACVAGEAKSENAVTSLTVGRLSPIG